MVPIKKIFFKKTVSRKKPYLGDCIIRSNFKTKLTFLVIFVPRLFCPTRPELFHVTLLDYKKKKKNNTRRNGLGLARILFLKLQFLLAELMIFEPFLCKYELV